MFTEATPSLSLDHEISEICPFPKELTISNLAGCREQTVTRRTLSLSHWEPCPRMLAGC